MVTKQQSLTANNFHYGTCIRVIGPHGAIKETTDHWRRNGATQVWKTRPDDFRVPIKHALSYYGQLTSHEMHMFHTAEDCPLNDPAYVTKDNRTEAYKKSLENVVKCWNCKSVKRIESGLCSNCGRFGI